MTDIILIGLVIAILFFCAIMNDLLMAHRRTISKLNDFNAAVEHLDEINKKFVDYSQRVERYQGALADIHIALTDIRFELDSMAIRDRKSTRN